MMSSACASPTTRSSSSSPRSTSSSACAPSCVHANIDRPASDTKLTGKALAADIAAHAPTLASSAQGRRALLYPLAGRARRVLTPAQIAAPSVSDAGGRAAADRRAASEGLLAWVARDGAEVALDTGGSLVVADVLLLADGDKTPAMDALLAPLAAPYPSPDESAPHPLARAHVARLHKTLLQGGHFSQAAGAVDVSPHFSASAYAGAWAASVGREVTLAAGAGEGAFVVAALCARLARDGPPGARKEVAGWFEDGGRERVSAWEGRGKAVLEEAVDELMVAAAADADA
jgi:pumilio family protein 6